MKNLPLNKIRFCALDLETTGVNPAFHRIVEVGAVKFTLEEDGETFSKLVNPGMTMPPEVTAIHGITDDMVADAPLFSEIAEDLLEFIGDAVLIIHNPFFDLSFLQAGYINSNLEAPQLRALDTVRLAKRTYTTLSNHKLDTVCDYLNITFKHHRATDDAIACRDIFRDVIKRQDPDGRWKWQELIAIHGAPISAKDRKVKVRSHSEFKPGDRIKIKYKDSNGNVTEREILSKEVFVYGEREYLRAHCLLRNEDRYFRTCRIVSISKL